MVTENRRFRWTNHSSFFLPRLTGSSWDDLNAFISCGFFPGDLFEIPFGLVEPCMAHFESGDIFAAMDFHYYTGGSERVRILHKAGLILYERTTTLGFRQAFIHSVALISRTVFRWVDRIQHLQRACVGRFLALEVAPALLGYLEAAGESELYEKIQQLLSWERLRPS